MGGQGLAAMQAGSTIREASGAGMSGETFPAWARARPILGRLAVLRLRVEPSAEGWIVDLGASRRLRLDHVGRSAPLPLVLDGAAFAALPLALREGRPLHVEGRLTRGALRNLRELAEAWADWSPDRFQAVPVTCEEVADERRPHGPATAAAWSGDLRSTFAALGGEPSLAEAGFRVDEVVHVAGLPGPAPAPGAVARLSEAFAALGIRLTLVRADAEGFLDPAIGALPLVAAALHLVGDGRVGTAVHARSMPMSAQLVRPRPEPTLGDFHSGDRLGIMAIGGLASAPAMATHVMGRPGGAAILDGCRASGFAAPRCGRCRDCSILDLGLAGAGLGTGASRVLPDLLPEEAGLVAEEALALRDWSGPAGLRARLAARVAGRDVRRARRDRAHWREAQAGRAEPWPR